MKHSLAPEDDNICVAEIKSAYGIKGWLWLYSHTEPMQAVFDYSPLFFIKNDIKYDLNVEKWRKQGKGLVVKLKGYDDRTASEKLISTQIFLNTKDFPAPENDEFYWKDLIGLTVFSNTGDNLGKVKGLFESKAHQIIEVEATLNSVDNETRLIPWHETVIERVDIDAGKVIVDWQVDY